jgi:hypothetical protein
MVLSTFLPEQAVKEPTETEAKTQRKAIEKILSKLFLIPFFPKITISTPP